LAETLNIGLYISRSNIDVTD